MDKIAIGLAFATFALVVGAWGNHVSGRLFSQERHQLLVSCEDGFQRDCKELINRYGEK